MKTLFFIAALAGAVYLVMQTPAGKAWFKEDKPELNIQQEIKEVQQVSMQAAKMLENKMTQLSQRLNQKQQAQIKQLENRLAELENELIMSRIAQHQSQNVSSEKLTLPPYKEPQKKSVALPFKQSVDADKPVHQTLAVSSDKQLQRKRQARLQDIAKKMELSSLQAWVN